MKSLFASYHQENVFLFGNNAGFQCTAVALAAIILASYFPANEWHSSALDSVRFYGDTLYSDATDANYGGQQVYLMPSYLPIDVQFQDRQLEISYQTDEIHGVTTAGSQSVYTNFLAFPLDQGLMLALSSTDFALLTVGQLTVTVIHNTVYDTCHVVDSHCRDQWGIPSPTGAAVLMSFPSLDDLCAYFQRIYNNQLYNLTHACIFDRRNSSKTHLR